MAASRAFTSVLRTVLAVLVATQLVGFFSSTTFAYAQAPEGSSQVQDAFSQEEFLALTNAARAKQGQAPLVLNDRLHVAAEAKVADMVAKGYWDHFRPGDGKAPWAFIDEAGYSYKVAGENLARGFRTPEGITTAWLNSPTHRANLLSAKYTEVGFASIRTIDAEGKAVLLTVQMFGSR